MSYIDFKDAHAKTPREAYLIDQLYVNYCKQYPKLKESEVVQILRGVALGLPAA